jgi:type IV pilus assembly protein PilM
MAAASDAIWAVDLGNNSLKALHLVAVGDMVQVIGFDHIPHNKILSSSGVTPAERDELIAISLRQFAQRNDAYYDPLIVGVPSQSSFARFVTLPPVEQKKLPEIVRFEAAQQIPFDMNEVQWDYQLMSDPDDPEKRVGIFAIKNEVVNGAIEHFEREELGVSYVQMVPMALYNYLLYDRPDLAGSDKRAAVIVNVGADSTDLVVCTASGVWQRCIMMGGNAFTQAIAETFKLSFEKAEKLKRTAPVSKYARQIFQAMRPVFTDWTGEVQRSLGFYSNSNPDVKLARVIGMGGGTRLRGLLKYLQQSLQIPVEKPDAFKRLAIAQGLSSAKFHENVADFGVVYGLGLQGLGMARIESNLLPTSVARSMAWASKTKYFIGAAVLLLFVSAMCLGRVGLDHMSYARNNRTRATARRIASQGEQVIQNKDRFRSLESEIESRIRRQMEPFKYRDVVPKLHEIILSAVPNAETNPEQAELYQAFEQGDIDRVKQWDRKDRKQLFITHMNVFFSDDLATAQFGRTALMRRDAMMAMAAEGEGAAYEDEMMAEMEAIYGAEYLEMMGMGPGAAEEKDPGFVVSITGYSPYRDIGGLLDPPNVRNDPSRWGLVTRLQYLDEFLDVNMPFELYKKEEASQYRLKMDIVDIDETPMGIGEMEIRRNPEGTARGGTSRGSTALTMMGYMAGSGTPVLLDPMTKELISAEPMTDAAGRARMDAAGNPLLKVHDRWFSLDFKLKWTEAPKIEAAP